MRQLDPKVSIAAEIEVQPGGFVAVMVESKIFVALVTDFDEENHEAEVSLLAPPIPATVFSFSENILSYIAPVNDILCNIDLVELNGSKYQMESKNVSVLRKLARVQKSNKK